MLRRATAELFGTFWLVLGGCGTAVLAGKAVGLLGISIAFGLTVVAMAYAIGHISGAHLNPAVSVGLVAAGRMSVRELPAYLVAQVAGAIAAAALLMLIVKGGDVPWDNVARAGFASNGYADHSPGGYSMVSALVTEIVLTFFFLLAILGATDARSPAGFGGLAIGLTLTLIHLISIPVTNTSVNPARSTGPALFVGGWAVEQLWLFWVAPIAGAALAGFAYRWLAPKTPASA